MTMMQFPKMMMSPQSCGAVYRLSPHQKTSDPSDESMGTTSSALNACAAETGVGLCCSHHDQEYAVKSDVKSDARRASAAFMPNPSYAEPRGPRRGANRVEGVGAAHAVGQPATKGPQTDGSICPRAKKQQLEQDMLSWKDEGLKGVEKKHPLGSRNWAEFHADQQVINDVYDVRPAAVLALLHSSSHSFQHWHWSSYT